MSQGLGFGGGAGSLSPTGGNTPGLLAPAWRLTLAGPWERPGQGQSPGAHPVPALLGLPGELCRAVEPPPSAAEEGGSRDAGGALARSYLEWTRPFGRDGLAMPCVAARRLKTRSGAPASACVGFRHVVQMFPCWRPERKRAGWAPGGVSQPQRATASQGSRVISPEAAPSRWAAHAQKNPARSFSAGTLGSSRSREFMGGYETGSFPRKDHFTENKENRLVLFVYVTIEQVFISAAMIPTLISNQ